MNSFYIILLSLNVLVWNSNGQPSFNSQHLSSAKIIFYYGPMVKHNAAYNLEESSTILNHPYFDHNKITSFYIHGYIEKQSDESIATIVTAYNRRKDHNLLVLDWAVLASENYIKVVLRNITKLGDKLALIFLELFNLGLKLQNFHLVGHSLGGQMAGRIGRTIINESNGNIILPRITALDPAFPGFYVINLETHISAADAKFVDVIHTDAFIYGAPIPTGTVDFWPNGGVTLQPGCVQRNFHFLTDNDLCSHRRSWRYWAESVSNLSKNKFLAVQFNTWLNFIIYSPSLGQTPVVMGLQCPTNSKGMYFLQTNSKRPYAKGVKGIVYEHP